MSDTLIGLSPEEIERYKPHHTWTEFTEGYDDYMLGVTQGIWQNRYYDSNTVSAQAYDRGAELAMRRHAAAQRKEWGLAVFV